MSDLDIITAIRAGPTAASALATGAATAALQGVRIPQAVQSVTIATGAGTASAEIDLGAASAAGIILPADWVTSDITFKVSDDSGGTYQDLYNEAGAKITLAAMQASWSIGLDAVGSALFAFRYVKIVSVTSQAGTKTIKIVSKG